MLDNTLGFLRDALNHHIAAGPHAGADLVVLGKPRTLDASVAGHLGGKLLMSLLHIGRDTSAVPFAQSRAADAGDLRSTPPLQLELTVLVSASFTDHEVGLKHLSTVLAYFHAHPVFHAGSAPAMPKGLDRVDVGIADLDVCGLNQLWASIGGNALPAVVYRVRVLAPAEAADTEALPATPQQALDTTD